MFFMLIQLTIQVTVSCIAPFFLSSFFFFVFFVLQNTFYSAPAKFLTQGDKTSLNSADGGGNEFLKSQQSTRNFQCYPFLAFAVNQDLENIDIKNPSPNEPFSFLFLGWNFPYHHLCFFFFSLSFSKFPYQMVLPITQTICTLAIINIT